MNSSHINFTSKLNKLSAWLGTGRFYAIVLACFIFESVWIAFTALYPQAFDENFHFGLIKVYSHYWLPFLSQQPPNANTYGAVARDPSYLYHYLMSFPYRFIALFIHGQTLQVVSLRLIDIALFTVGLIYFRKVLIKVGISKSLTNVSILLFILIPIVPQLAAQVSYDDLLFPMVAWLCYLTFDLIDQIKRHKLSSKDFIRLLIGCFLATVVKYAFLPIFLAIILFLVLYIYREYSHDIKLFIKELAIDFNKQSKWVKLILCTLLIMSVGLVAQRDAINLVKYHKVEPNCSKVLTVKQCSAYSPWFYNYSNHKDVLSGNKVASDNILIYTKDWFYYMWYRLFFAVNGPTAGFANTPPMLLPSLAIVIVAFIALVAILKAWKSIFRNNPRLTFLCLVCLIYGATLYAQGYATYEYTAVLENMNGRYLLPVLLPLAAVCGTAISIAMGRKANNQKTLAALVIMVMFLEGGGLATFIIRSDKTWDWPNNTVVNVNNTARSVVKRVVIKSDPKDEL